MAGGVRMADEDILDTIKKRYRTAVDGWNYIHEDALSDLRFAYDVDGGQWPDEIRQDRAGRPMITVNKLLKFIRQLRGEGKMNRPTMKVIPVDDLADVKMAELYNGLINQIEYLSSADVAYDTAYMNAVSASMGFFRIITKYENEFSFNQEILIKRISNLFQVKYDPAAREFDYSDADYCFIDEWMTKKDFKAAFPDAEIQDFGQNQRGQNYQGWFEEDRVLITEYYYKEKKKIKIGMVEIALPDGRVNRGVIELTNDVRKRLEEDPRSRLLQERDSETIQVKWKKVTGAEVLEETDWPGKYIPVIPVFGDEIVVNGRKYYMSLIRGAKGPQQMYNYWSSCATETVALAPKAPYVVATKQVEGLENEWNEANRKNRMILRYKHIPGLQKPSREPQTQVPAAIVAMMQNTAFELEDHLGRYESSKGAPSNERSGIAIQSRIAQSDKGTFTFVDNFARALIYSTRQLIDLIPKIYDTQRALRVRGEDGSERIENVNVNTGRIDVAGRPEVLNDLTVGKYDLIATTGASFSSRRQELRQSLLESLQYAGPYAPVILPFIFKYSDSPEAEEIATAIKEFGMQGSQAGQGGPNGQIITEQGGFNVG